MKFLILNGPGLNHLRYTQPDLPGEMDFEMLADYVTGFCQQIGAEADFFQSNHEGDLIDEIQHAEGRVDGIVFNPAGYAHTSVALLDAIRACSLPVVEVLLDAPSPKEPFRQTDIVSFGCQGHFIGQGPLGYLHAIAYLAQLLRVDSGPHIAM